MAPIEHEALKRFKENYPDFKPDEVRLIDANVLRKDIEMLRNKSCFDISEDLTSHDTVGFWAGFEYLAKFIESAPTVETTDEVLARMNERTGEVILRNSFQESEWIARYYPTRNEISEGIKSPENGFGKNPLEAIKKLEASINLK